MCVYKYMFSQSFKELISKLTRSLGRDDIKYGSCQENPSEHNNVTYSCFINHICKSVEQSPVHSIPRKYQSISTDKLNSLYNTVLNQCGVNKRDNVKYDIIVYNRYKTRKILNIEHLCTEFESANLTYYVVPANFMSNASQCDMFNLFSKANIVIGPYGSDLTYPMILQKHTFALMSKFASEHFYEQMRGHMNNVEVVYRMIYTDVAETEEEELLLLDSKANTFSKWETENYRKHNLQLTSDNIKEIIYFTQKMKSFGAY